MKNLVLIICILLVSAISFADSKLILEVDCFAFADSVEGMHGDSGDFEVWSQAFEFCANKQGFPTVVIGD